ncbi:cis-prenyltransferase [Pichia californica]|uniref:Alkyl transferase n=1 Tax=Pichia californica TaxID=460514 RepID=A0A9P7BFV6_9ASCO|nr:cis-prenyltransferase [[Candida] californica]KAG0687663.1 cis-prenyltransferase [[Candida] californica]
MTDWLASFPLTQRVMEMGKVQICKSLRTGPVPQHIGFIMDGNRTYAKIKHIELKEGHSAGFESMARILEVCYDCGVKCASVFAFSIENYKRSSYEIQWLMELAKTKFKQVVGNGEICEQFGIQIRILGDLDLVPDDVKQVLLQAQEITKHNTRAVLNVCWSYTSRDDMTHSIKEILHKVTKNQLKVKDIDEDCISKNLYTGDSPPLDLLIRTSGVYRLSDFMLWESSKEGCDIEILDVLWPQFNAMNMVWILIKWSFSKTYNVKNKNLNPKATSNISNDNSNDSGVKKSLVNKL